jgi:hypothetical protein
MRPIGRHCFVFLRAFRLFPRSARILFASSVSVKARHSFLGWRGPKGAPMRNCGALRRRLEREFPAVQAALDSPLEYWAGRRADYQAQIAQASDVWASPYRSVTFAGAPCGLTSSCKGTRDGWAPRGSASRAGSHVALSGVVKFVR